MTNIKDIANNDLQILLNEVENRKIFLESVLKQEYVIKILDTIQDFHNVKLKYYQYLKYPKNLLWSDKFEKSCIFTFDFWKTAQNENVEIEFLTSDDNSGIIWADFYFVKNDIIFYADELFVFMERSGIKSLFRYDKDFINNINDFDPPESFIKNLHQKTIDAFYILLNKNDVDVNLFSDKASQNACTLEIDLIQVINDFKKKQIFK